MIFGRYLLDALGVPAEPGSAPVAAEPTVTDAEPEHQDDIEEDDETETEPVVRPSVMITGEIPGYAWDDARQAVRNLGYEVVGRADDSTVLIICGEGAERATTKLREAAERGIPCMDATGPSVFKFAVCAGELVGGDPLPEPVRKDAQSVRDDRASEAQSIREWAKDNGLTVRAKGRIPAHVSHAYRVATESSKTAA